MIKLSILTIALVASMSANAAYQLRIPLEQSLSGSLPDHSIKFSGQLEIPEVEKTPAEICDEKAEIAKAFFAKNYSDASYNSHKYVEYLIGYPTPSLEAVCQMNFNTPANKSFNCVGNNTYAQNIGNSMNGIGFDLAEPVYFGTCS